MGSKVMLASEPMDQIAALKQSTLSLQYTAEESDLTYHAKEELRELFNAVCLSERHLEELKIAEPNIQKKLQVYLSIMVDLEKIQMCTGVVEEEDLIEDIRALLSDVTFGLSIMNAHMIVSSQNNLNLMLRDYIIDIATKRRDANALSDVFNAASSFEMNMAWTQCEEEQDFILMTLRKAALESKLLGDVVKPCEEEIPEAPSPTTFTNSSNADGSDSSIYSRSSTESFTESVERVSLKNYHSPIPVETRVKAKRRLTLQTFGLSGFSEPSESILALGDFNPKPKTAIAPPTSESSGSLHTSDGTRAVVKSRLNRSSSERKSRGRSASEGNGFMDPSTPVPLVVTEVTATMKGKKPKPGLMSRMKFKMLNNKEEFCVLIQSGDIEQVRSVLDRGASANPENAQGQTGLIIAVANNHKEVAKLLLDRGARIDSVAEDGDTALSMATYLGYEDITKMLLRRGANPNAASFYGKTALSQAATADNLTLTHLLLDYGADPNSCTSTGEIPLAYAAAHGHFDIAQLLLSRGSLADEIGLGGHTPLFRAVENGSLRMVELLLEKGADPHKRSRNNTPLKFAIRECKQEILTLFIRYGFYNTGYRKNMTRRASRSGLILSLANVSAEIMPPIV
ncbi:hypothetical protein N7493_000014 [Penicillium malachiteum]|uniref:Ankyrin repeat protein n=1 Tax=Penicillium malachiteum TaxID=1324776 RepID=A0AAD6N0L5_9EURO|nr:hypothetical protein N7493_000014 [Penicillium malachiteum]